jgi:UDP-glucose:(heptosyl)LPS alpha-1,3-glucosyltransferase
MGSKNKVLAFCLFKYFPHGGLQRDMVLVAQACLARGYAIEVYTTSWQGPVPEGFSVHTLRCTAWTNHGRMRQYHRWLTSQLESHPVDGVVGFNKMPGLDVYFAADTCFVEKASRRYMGLYRLTSRYRTYAELEATVFSPSSRTEILLIAEPQHTAFRKHYDTPASRLHLLPPWISADRKPPEDRLRARRSIRKQLGISKEAVVLVQVGSPFKTKGVDRTLRAMANLPRAICDAVRLVVVGHNRGRGYERLSARLGLSDSVLFAGQRDDIMEVLAASDLMVHPARTEAAGVVLIEALASGLPVVCSGTCGHAGQVRKADAGIVLEEPFRQGDLDDALAQILQGDRLARYAANAGEFARSQDFHRMPERAAAIIESVIARNSRSSPAAVVPANPVDKRDSV